MEKVWKDIGGNQDKILSTEKFGGYKIEVKERMERRERLALRNKVKEEERLRDNTGIDRNENEFARPNGLRENAETTICVRDLDLPERRDTSTGIPGGGCADVPLWQSNIIELT